MGSMALAGGRLLARDLTRMVCLDVGTGPSGSAPLSLSYWWKQFALDKPGRTFHCPPVAGRY